MWSFLTFTKVGWLADVAGVRLVFVVGVIEGISKVMSSRLSNVPKSCIVWESKYVPGSLNSRLRRLLKRSTSPKLALTAVIPQRVR